MIRTIITFAFIGLYLLVGIILLPIYNNIGKKDPEKRDRLVYRSIQWVFKVMLFLTGVKVSVSGKENLKEDEPVLYVSNHEGLFDIIISYIHFPRPTGFVAKKELGKAPLFSDWLLATHSKFLDRNNIKEGLKTILACIEDVKKGISICIFPEGTRNKTPGNGLLPFKDGSMKIAEKTGCPIIPMAVRHTGEVFEDQFPSVRPRTVYLKFGKPIYMKDLDPEDRKHMGAYMQRVVEQLLREIDREEALG